MKKKIFAYLKRKLSYSAYKSIRMAYRDITGFKKMTREEKAKQSYFFSRKKADDKYVIFRFIMPNYMLFAAGNIYAFMYSSAIKNGLIPVMDMELEYDFENYRLGKENLWDACFRQDVTVQEALTKKWVLVEDVYVDRELLSEACMDINGDPDDHSIHSTMENWREYYAKVHEMIEPCWKFQTSIIGAYEKDVKEKIQMDDCIAGVFLRESFSREVEKYALPASTEAVYRRHPRTYGLEETIACVKEFMDKWGCNKIFLATVFQESAERFIQEFGQDKIILVPRERNSFAESMLAAKPIWDYSSKERYEQYVKENMGSSWEKTSVSYAEEVLALSKCDYYIGAKGSGGAAALALNGGQYRDIFILPDFHNIMRY